MNDAPKNWRNVVRVEFRNGQIEHVEEAAAKYGLPLEEFVRRATIEAANSTLMHGTFSTSWGSVKRYVMTGHG